MTADDGFPEAEDLHLSRYEPPAVFDAGKVVMVTCGSGGGSSDSNGQEST